MTDQTQLEEKYVGMIKERRGLQKSLSLYDDDRVYVIDEAIERVKDSVDLINIRRPLTNAPDDRYVIEWLGADPTDSFDVEFDVEGRLDMIGSSGIDPVLGVFAGKSGALTKAINSYQYPAFDGKTQGDLIERKEELIDYVRSLFSNIRGDMQEEITRIQGGDIEQEIETAPDNITGMDRLK